jgi:hypothetical protein
MFDMFSHPSADSDSDSDDFSQLQPGDNVRAKAQLPIYGGCRGKVVKHDQFGVQVDFSSEDNQEETMTVDRDELIKI